MASDGALFPRVVSDGYHATDRNGGLQHSQGAKQWPHTFQAGNRKETDNDTDPCRDNPDEYRGSCLGLGGDVGH